MRVHVCMYFFNSACTRDVLFYISQQDNIIYSIYSLYDGKLKRSTALLYIEVKSGWLVMAVQFFFCNHRTRAFFDMYIYTHYTYIPRSNTAAYIFMFYFHSTIYCAFTTTAVITRRQENGLKYTSNITRVVYHVL